jgi:hypothetical protein
MAQPSRAREGLPGWIAKGYPVDGKNPGAPPAH